MRIRIYGPSRLEKRLEKRKWKLVTMVQLQLLEVWEPVPGFAPYEASTFGKIRRNGRVIKFTATGRYNCMYFNGKHMGAHSVVALTFLGKRPKNHIVNHIDGIVNNNRADNLEYISRIGNTHHGILKSRNFDFKESHCKTYQEEREKARKAVKRLNKGV